MTHSKNPIDWSWFLPDEQEQIKKIPNFNWLRPYQQEDIAKLLDLNFTGCFNEQRTGKTPTAIMTMECRPDVDRILITCPASMLYPWRDAYKEWTNKDAIICTGSIKKRIELIKQWKHGPLIISYGCLKETKRTDGMLDYIIKQNPDACIADEAHKFKCHTTATAKAMYTIRKHIKYGLALTGTPATNKPEDIYGILHWLLPETYNSYWNFINNNFITRKQYRGFNKTYTEVVDWIPTRKQIMMNQLAMFSTQRKRIDVMPWLPTKDYLQIRLTPTPTQQRYIKELSEYFETENLITQGILDRMIKERQLCVAPQIVDLKGSSPKIDWIVDYFSDYPDKSIILFSKFVKGIHLIHQTLSEKKIKGQVITGSVPPKQRAEIVSEFQQGKLRYLILQIDACREGLTLDNADVEIFVDAYPPAADIQQAEDRFVATTEDKADKSHQIIQLMLTDTYDEECYKLVARRASSIDCINSYINYIKNKR